MKMFAYQKSCANKSHRISLSKVVKARKILKLIMSYQKIHDWFCSLANIADPDTLIQRKSGFYYDMNLRS
jgi:hypothetical protein